jgi:hypothetical protein
MPGPRDRRKPSRWNNHEGGTRFGGVASSDRQVVASASTSEWTVAVDELHGPSRGERRRGTER